MTRTAPQAKTAPPADRRAAIRRKLLRWYDRNKRDLPWRRRAGDPYAQWVAEIMLQQTRVDTVIDYYERFLKRFPTLEALANARHDVVLKHWEGLGYYRRILHLHRAARVLRDDGCEVPRSAEALQALPGVGAYTAAAIASIAFNERAAAVDGNVSRVIARLCGLTEDVTTPAGRDRVRIMAQALLPRNRPGDFNQAWMDLGSAICTPRSPACDRCPLAADCIAAANDLAQSLPVRQAGGTRAIPQVDIVVALFVHEGRMFVRQRPRGGLWSGLWEFPNVERAARSKGNRDGRPPRAQSNHSTQTGKDVRLVQRLAEASGVDIQESPSRVATVYHQLTHRSLVFHVYSAASRPGRKVKDSRATRWTSIQGFARLSVSTAHRRICKSAQNTISKQVK